MSVDKFNILLIVGNRCKKNQPMDWLSWLVSSLDQIDFVSAKVSKWVY